MDLSPFSSPMVHPWLAVNVRIYWLLIGLGVVFIAAGALVGWSVSFWPVRVPGALLVLVGLSLVVWGLLQLRRPRLAYDDAGELLVYLRRDSPLRVPIDAVEAFFLGRAPSPLHSRTRHRVKNTTVVIRLAERAKSWHDRQVDPRLGRWSDGYVTVYGVWCEPLDAAVVQRLNQHLLQVKQKRRVQREGTDT